MGCAPAGGKAGHVPARRGHRGGASAEDIRAALGAETGEGVGIQFAQFGWNTGLLRQVTNWGYQPKGSIIRSDFPITRASSSEPRSAHRSWRTPRGMSATVDAMPGLLVALDIERMVIVLAMLRDIDVRGTVDVLAPLCLRLASAE